LASQSLNKISKGVLATNLASQDIFNHKICFAASNLACQNTIKYQIKYDKQYAQAQILYAEG